VTTEPAVLPRESTTTVEEAYEALFTAHFANLVRLAGLLGAEDPEDVAQEAFVRLHAHRATLRDPGAAPAWLTRAVVNLTRSRGRRLRVARRRTPHEVATAPAAETTAAERAEHREVVAALRTLNPRQRRVLVLRYWQDLPLAEIAATLGLPLGTVKSNHSRGLAALARRLEDQ
jgi:RNA polymerase sigma-70 factor (sigma-E family)